MSGRKFPLRTQNDCIVYLSPELLSAPLEEIRGVIAHELAHVFLGHDEVSMPLGQAEIVGNRDEDAADRLAESWGFKLPASYRERLRLDS